MQPKSSKPYRSESLDRLNEKIFFTKRCYDQRLKEPAYAMPLPAEVGLKLTNRCDLRCKHCFQWNDIGYHKTLSSEELSKNGDLHIEIVAKALDATKPLKSHLYLWGGEPLIYSYWDELIDLLAVDKRKTVICTNGVSLDKKIESLNRISEGLTVLTSIEGNEEQHDKLRGKNSFKKIMSNLSSLFDCQNNGTFKGTVSIATVINDDLIGNLYDFCCHFNEYQIDTLYLNFPWYIPEQEAGMMDVFFKEKFGWMNTDRGNLNSWHSFQWHLNDELMEDLKIQVRLIQSRKWNIRIRFQPEMTIEEMYRYIKGDNKPVQGKKMCLGISNRMDIMPDGSVCPCKKFTEFTVGNLTKDSIEEVWKGAAFDKFRAIHNNELMSICAKCEILYSNGI